MQACQSSTMVILGNDWWFHSACEFMHSPLVLASSVSLGSVTCLRRQSSSKVPVTLILKTGGGSTGDNTHHKCKQHTYGLRRKYDSITLYTSWRCMQRCMRVTGTELPRDFCARIMLVLGLVKIDLEVCVCKLLFCIATKNSVIHFLNINSYFWFTDARFYECYGFREIHIASDVSFQPELSIYCTLNVGCTVIIDDCWICLHMNICDISDFWPQVSTIQRPLHSTWWNWQYPVTPTLPSDIVNT